MKSIGQKIELLRVIAHPVRVKILEELSKGVKCVSDLEKFLEVSQPNISQHLSLLRNHSVINFYMDGRLKCYFLVDPIIPDLLELLNRTYDESLPPPKCCPVKSVEKEEEKKKGAAPLSLTLQDAPGPLIPSCKGSQTP
ncbi:MAG: winged helix-turn-helix transcriptional regulator [Nitrospirae bacterium]|nr:winged helix-turn-helix transcriptional regulator [Nitrospirota bacterium]MBF0591672.1 winged helix-turn-helix transcriptional regulator [Nitrospirota bacterium]